MGQESLSKQGRIVNCRELHDSFSFISKGAESGVGQDVKFFVGQERPRRELADVINQSPPGTVVIISEPFGAGKSFLIEAVLKDLHKRPGDEYSRTSTYRLEGAMGNFEVKPPKVIFVEEFDRKLSFAELQQRMRLVAEIAKRKESLVVLSGDYSLRNPALVGLLNLEGEPVSINMDTLNEKMLKKAFELRLCEALGEKMGEINIDGLFSNAFMNYLIPNANPSISTIRSSFSILGEMTSVIETSSSPAQFSGEIYEKLRSSRVDREFDSKTWHFVSWLHRYIENHASSIPMEPLKVSDFINLYGSGEISKDEFPTILAGLARRNILNSVGTPYLDNKNNGTPEPYLPSQKTFLDAVFYPLPQNTPVEQSKIDEVVNKKSQLERLNSLLQDGHITQPVFDQKRNEILELDELITAYIEGEISREIFEEQKQEIEKKYL